MKAFRVGLYVSIRLRHASVSSTEETALLLKRSDAFFNVRSAKSCDAAKLGGKSRPAAPATPVERKLLRVQESVILRISNESSGSAEYISTRQEEAFAPLTRGKRRRVEALSEASRRE